MLIEQSIMSWLPTNSKVLNLPTPPLSIQMASIPAGINGYYRFAAGIVLRRIHWFFGCLVCVGGCRSVCTVAIPLAKGLEVQSMGDATVVAFVFP